MKKQLAVTDFAARQPTPLPPLNDAAKYRTASQNP